MTTDTDDYAPYQKDGTYAYVPHHRQKEFEAIGWEFEADLGPPHCVYSSLYKWVGEGEAVYPIFDCSLDHAMFDECIDVEDDD